VKTFVALCALIFLTAGGATGTAAPVSADYDALHPDVLAGFECANANVVCFAVPAGSTNAHLRIVDLINLPGVPTPAQIQTTDGTVLARGTFCGEGDLVLTPTTTLISIRFVPSPVQTCDFPCQLDCSNSAVPTRGTVTALFS